MTTTATIPAGPTTYALDSSVTSLTYTVETPSAWTSTNSNFTSQTTTWITSVKVALVGQSDSAKEPAKTMNSWYSTNTSAITANSLTTELKVSSWALIVDVATKALTANATALSAYNQATNKDANGNCLQNAAGTPAANSGLPVVGNFGDSWAVAINLPTTSGAKQPDVIRSGSQVSAVGTTTPSAAQTSALVEESWTGAFATALTSYTDVSKNTANVGFTFTSKNTCDTKKWASATACFGFEGKWGKNANTFAVGTTAGTHRYFLWLADAATDKTKIVSIEDKDVINVAVIEAHANVYSTTANQNTLSCSNQGRDGKTEYGVVTGTYTKGKGATSTILGASALVAGLIASLF
jgi:hypothetical protein